MDGISALIVVVLTFFEPVGFPLSVIIGIACASMYAQVCGSKQVTTLFALGVGIVIDSLTLTRLGTTSFILLAALTAFVIIFTKIEKYAKWPLFVVAPISIMARQIIAYQEWNLWSLLLGSAACILFYQIYSYFDTGSTISIRDQRFL